MTTQKDVLDRFYTKEEVSTYCLDVLFSLIGKDHTFLEPSAGGGSFYKQLPKGKRRGIDISPQCEGVQEGDYLLSPPPTAGVVVGNPPFGKRNSLSKSFIKHSLGADVIAFILPSVYKKETMQSVFPNNWELVVSIDTPNNSFLFEGEDYHVPCVFQVWVKGGLSGYPNIRESIKEKRTTTDFSFTTKTDKESQWFMFGAAPHKIIPSVDVDRNNRGYYIKGASAEVITLLREIDWKSTACSSASGGVAWWTKQQIIDIYLNSKEKGYEKQPKS